MGGDAADVNTAPVRSVSMLVAAALLAGLPSAPAGAATPRLGGPCKKIHQVDWIKGVRAQCTWVKLTVPKKKRTGKLVWKPLPPPKVTASRAELNLPPAPSPTASASPSASASPAPTESTAGG